MRRYGMLFLGLFLMISAVPAVMAASWMSDGNKRNVVTLVVCTNTKSARLMADTIQAESKQPYLLLPAPGSKDERVFFVPAKGPAIELLPAKVVHFIRFLNPKRVVVLNGAGLVYPKYKAYFDTNVPTMVVNSRNWERTAQELSYMLNITSLARDYKRLRDKMLSDADMYRMISDPAPKAPAEPKAEEVTPAAAPAAEAPAVEKVEEVTPAAADNKAETPAEK
ncbi:MAG: hypothetical protein IJV89_05920 [Lentisphaeria bacterium]|nr:hypothetical protein [Lentisphaeria bacterium]